MSLSLSSITIYYLTRATFFSSRAILICRHCPPSAATTISHVTTAIVTRVRAQQNVSGWIRLLLQVDDTEQTPADLANSTLGTSFLS